MRGSPFLGSIFEGFVASEILKAQVNAGSRPELYYFRDYTGLEVDFIVASPGGRTLLIEAKASRTIRPEAAEPLQRVARGMQSNNKQRAPRSLVVHEGKALQTTALAPGVEAVDLAGLLKALPG